MAGRVHDSPFGDSARQQARRPFPAALRARLRAQRDHESRLPVEQRRHRRGRPLATRRRGAGSPPALSAGAYCRRSACGSGTPPPPAGRSTAARRQRLGAGSAPGAAAAPAGCYPSACRSLHRRSCALGPGVARYASLAATLLLGPERPRSMQAYPARDGRVDGARVPRNNCRSHRELRTVADADRDGAAAAAAELAPPKALLEGSGKQLR